jgi:hypothetical protein
MSNDLRKLFGGHAEAGGTGSTAETVRHDHVRPGREVFRPPHVLRATLLVPIPCAAPLVLWETGAIPAASAIVSGAVLSVMAGGHVGYLRFDLWRCRRLADRLLLTHPRGRVSSALADWRAAELTSERARRNLAGWVHDLIRETDRRARPSWTPLNRGAARQSLFLLRRLEQRLGDPFHPISPRGMLVVRELLADGTTSPLYRPDRAEHLADALAEALAALDVQR